MAWGIGESLFWLNNTGTMSTQVKPEFQEFHRPPQLLSNCPRPGGSINILLNNLCLLNNLWIFIFIHNSSRSSLASGSLIGSTLKARMDPSSQVCFKRQPWHTRLSGICLEARCNAQFQVNISVSRPGASSRPSDQPAPPRPISNGLPVAVTHQPVKAPVQMAPQVSFPLSGGGQ